MELDALVREYADSGIRVGEALYSELTTTAKRVVLGRRYPPSYSPTGNWDDDGIIGMAHEWIAEKLLRLGHLEHLLLTNTTLRGFRKGLDLSFADYVVGQRKRTTLDHLFRRTAKILEADARFALNVDSPKKALRVWGLTPWGKTEAFAGRPEDLIRIGFTLQGFPIVVYRATAAKQSPILRDPDIANFVEGLLTRVGAGLTLAQICLVYKYRFSLLSEETVSLDEVLPDDDSGGLVRGNLIASQGETPEEAAVFDEVAELVLQEMSPRQRLCFKRYHEPGATLERVATLADCKKSTVENEVKGTVAMLERHARNAVEAEAIYERLLSKLDEMAEEAS